MLSIRPAQWRALTELGLVRFEHEMTEHLSDFAPELAQFAGRDSIRAVVRLGIARARVYGFTHRGPLRTYLEVMLVLGSYFDTDPALRPATAALRAAPVEQHARAGGFHNAVMEYCGRVSGLQYEHTVAAMRRLSAVSYESLAGDGSFRERALLLFRGCFPEKYSYAGDAALHELATSAARRSEEFSVRSDAGRQLIALLLYLFGHGAFADPAYCWMAQTMRDGALPDPEQRVRDLHRKTHLYVATFLKTEAA